MKDSTYPDALKKLIKTINRLPGIGSRTAERLALSLYDWQENELIHFGTQLQELKQKVTPCKQCGNFSSENELCEICKDTTRNFRQLCIIESASQISVIEKSGSFKGLYHVLGGRLSPINGHGPDKLNLKIRERCERVEEIIMATSSDFDGEATAAYIARELQGLPIEISRISRGIPMGADISYADSASMAIALNTRQTL
jgi:recombination protein RecR